MYDRTIPALLRLDTGDAASRSDSADGTRDMIMDDAEDVGDRLPSTFTALESRRVEVRVLGESLLALERTKSRDRFSFSLRLSDTERPIFGREGEATAPLDVPILLESRLSTDGVVSDRRELSLSFPVSDRGLDSSTAGPSALVLVPASRIETSTPEAAGVIVCSER